MGLRSAVEPTLCPLVHWTLALGTGLAATSALVAAPQMLRTWQTRDLSGVSMTAQVAWVVSWTLWGIYALAIGATGKVIADAVGLVFDALLLALMFAVATAPGWRKTAARAAVLALAPVPLFGWIWAEYGVVWLAIALTVYDTIILAPQLRAALFSSSVHGVSILAWVMRAATAVGWIVYAVGIGHLEAAGMYYVMLPAAALVCARVAVSRIKEKAPAIVEACRAGCVQTCCVVTA